MTVLPALALFWWMPDWPAAWAVLALLTTQRLLELVHARRNTRALLARGAEEHGARHYPWMVAIHATFLVALWLATAPEQPMFWPFLILFALLQLARLWVLATLGPYWTTRIISAPDFPRIVRGPYRFVQHPNYWVVTLEILVIPLVFGHLWIALVWSLFNAAILAVRIRAENAALAGRLAQKPVA